MMCLIGQLRVQVQYIVCTALPDRVRVGGEAEGGGDGVLGRPIVLTLQRKENLFSKEGQKFLAKPSHVIQFLPQEYEVKKM